MITTFMSELGNMSHIKGDNRTQTTAFPFTLEELIAQDNPVRIIDLFVEGLDLNKSSLLQKENRLTAGLPTIIKYCSSFIYMDI